MAWEWPSASLYIVDMCLSWQGSRSISVLGSAFKTISRSGTQGRGSTISKFALATSSIRTLFEDEKVGLPIDSTRLPSLVSRGSPTPYQEKLTDALTSYSSVKLRSDLCLKS